MITSEMRVVLVFFTSLFSVLILIPKLARIAARIGLVDHPAKRKVHNKPLPLIGGIAMGISTTFSCLLFIPLVGLRGYFVGMAILLLIGFLDDYKEIGHREKFLAQVLATSILMYFSKEYLQSFGNLLGMGDIALPANQILIWIVTTFCVVGVINAINLLDGLDGLAGGFSFLAFMTFAAHASLTGDKTALLLNLSLVGALLGFLRFNWKEAQVFMGDAGSLCLGFSLAYMSLALTQGEGAKVSPVCALLILTVPIVDTLTVMTKRILRGGSPFKPDKYHLHHIFIRYGMSKEWAVRVILGITAILCGISLLGPIYNLPDWVLFLIFGLYCAGYFISSFYVIYLMRISHRIIRTRKLAIQHKGLNTIEAVLQKFAKLKFARFLRRSARHSVSLTMICLDTKTGTDFPGSIINISSGGLMAEIPGLNKLLGSTVLQISYGLDGEIRLIELPAKHVWLSQGGDAYHHGFEFLEFDGEQKDVIFSFLVKSKSDFS